MGVEVYFRRAMSEPEGLFLFQIKDTFLRIDIQPEIAEEIKSEKARDLTVGNHIVHGSGEILDLHPGNRNRVEADKWRLNQAVGCLERNSARVRIVCDRKFLGRCA